MNKFKIGDKVKLINNEFNYGLVSTYPHILDGVVTVIAVVGYGGDVIKVKLGDGKMIYLLSKRFELVEDPLDDRFEKWEERKVNEEYDYMNDEYEVGDIVELIRAQRLFFSYSNTVDQHKNSRNAPIDIFTSDDKFEILDVDYRESHDTIFMKGLKNDKSIIIGLNSNHVKLSESPLDPLDDRFEKWEEHKINEEYDYENNKYEVGDKLTCVKNFYMGYGELSFEKGNIYEIIFTKRNEYNYLLIDEQGDEHSMNIELLNNYFELVEEQPNDDRFEKWEEKVNEEYDYENNKYEVGDRVKYIGCKKDAKNQLGTVIGSVNKNNVMVEMDNKVGYWDSIAENYGAKEGRGISTYPFNFIIVEEPIDDDRFEKWEEKVNENNNIYFMKKYKDYIKENIRLIDGYWYPGVNIPLTLSDIRIRLVQADKQEKIKFILLFEDELGYDKEMLEDLDVSELEYIISDEISDFMISKKLNKAI